MWPFYSIEIYFNVQYQNSYDIIEFQIYGELWDCGIINSPFCIIYFDVSRKLSWMIAKIQTFMSPLTLKVPEKLPLYGLYVYYVVHICDFGMLRVNITNFSPVCSYFITLFRKLDVKSRHAPATFPLKV